MALPPSTPASTTGLPIRFQVAGLASLDLREPRLLRVAEQRALVRPLGAVAEVVRPRDPRHGRAGRRCTAVGRGGRCGRGRPRRRAGAPRAPGPTVARPGPGGAPTTPGRRRPGAPRRASSSPGSSTQPGAAVVVRHLVVVPREHERVARVGGAEVLVHAVRRVAQAVVGERLELRWSGSVLRSPVPAPGYS